MLLVISGCVYSIVVIKFIVSLSFSFGAKPAQMNAYNVLFVPCYTEGVSMKVTLETLACCVYDDRKKLMVVVCDGNITGKGNAKPTPNIVLDILGWSGNEPEPQYYLALGKGEDKINMAKVYSGLYEFNGHKVPYIVIAKVGKPSEAKKAKPGNRGKRDSQLILMNFFNKLCGEGKPMTPLEYELFYQINYVIGVNPNVYEYCLMVDADTEVEPEGLNALVASMVHDQRKIGVCGETTVANKWTSWVTWIQVHEYYINHHLGKTFESIFGSVTCLPGCFSMYRIRYLDGEPALVHDKIIEDYKLNKVHTLHSKNLLHLGEDRYLTTLLLKHFPGKRLEFIPSAVCKTDIPDTFEVLLSQRRRWINSTFHNLYELYNLPRLCNFCFISMKYLVLLDLLSTVILPASTLYLYAIVVRIFIEGIGKYTLVLGGALGLYATHLFIILLVKRQPEYCIWITVYIILALPVFSIVLPLYSFWHFDDFSWVRSSI
ncbi:chitin synthase-domain-containing protein [Paraphysoderma sedebokerense]|nr:chitin synthase-domain-containing protein [Paraphysoderma sedebokerense]